MCGCTRSLLLALLSERDNVDAPKRTDVFALGVVLWELLGNSKKVMDIVRILC